MKGRILLIFLLLAPLNTLATPTCTVQDGTDDPIQIENDCCGTQGKYCYNETTPTGTVWTSIACDTGSYCPGDGKKYECPTPFTATYVENPSAGQDPAIGATSIADCAIKVDKYIDSNGVEKNISPNEPQKFLYIKCNYLSSDGKCEHNPNGQNSIITTKPTQYSNPNISNTYNGVNIGFNAYWVFFKSDSSGYDTADKVLYVANHSSITTPSSDWYYEVNDEADCTTSTCNINEDFYTNENGYHIEVIPDYKETHYETGDVYNLRSSFVPILVANELNCDYFNKQITSCSGASSSCFLLDGTAGPNSQYIGHHDIGAEINTEMNPNSQLCNNPEGKAKWVANNDANNPFYYSSYRGYWDVSQCNCPGNEQYEGQAHCTKTIAYKPEQYQHNNELSGLDNLKPHSSQPEKQYALHNIYEHVIYSKTPGVKYCTACDDKYYPDCSTNSQGSCTVLPCSCKQIDKGYYYTGATSGNEMCTSLPTAPTPCPASKTTSSTGATNISQCIYTGASKFCDTGGCFTLEQLKNSYGIDYEASGNATWTDWN